MGNEVSTTTETKTTSDGRVDISVEKYNDLVNKEAKYRELRDKPPMVVNRTVVNKTDVMLAQESRLWGGSLMGLGAALFTIGGALFKAGRR